MKLDELLLTARNRDGAGIEVLLELLVTFDVEVTVLFVLLVVFVVVFVVRLLVVWLEVKGFTTVTAEVFDVKLEVVLVPLEVVLVVPLEVVFVLFGVLDTITGAVAFVLFGAVVTTVVVFVELVEFVLLFAVKLNVKVVFWTEFALFHVW